MTIEGCTLGCCETDVSGLLSKTERDKIRKRNQRAKLDERLKSKVKLYDQNKASRYRLQKQLSQKYKKASNISRQREFRLRQSIPSTPEKFQIVLDNFVKAGMSSPRKREILSNAVSKISPDDGKETNPIIRMKALKLQNRSNELEALVSKLVDEHGSKCKVAAFYKIRWATFLEMCKPGQKKVTKRQVKAKETREDIGEFYELVDVSTTVPSSRHAHNRFMLRTVDESY